MTDIIDIINSPVFTAIFELLNDVLDFIVAFLTSIFTAINTVIQLGSDSMTYIMGYLNSNLAVVSMVQSAFDTVPVIFVQLFIGSLLVAGVFGFLRNI